MVIMDSGVSNHPIKPTVQINADTTVPKIKMMIDILRNMNQSSAATSKRVKGGRCLKSFSVYLAMACDTRGIPI